MTDHRLPNPPKGYQRPSYLPLVTVAAVRALLPRLRCGTCGSRLSVEPATLGPGRLFCLACGRDYAEVVKDLPARVSFADEPRPRPGRPPKAASQEVEAC